MMGSVDNKRHCINTLTRQLITTVINVMEQSVSTWYELLLFVEDKLELSKCEWYIGDWRFDKNDKSQIKKTKQNLWINAPSGKKISSKQLNPNTPIDLSKSHFIDRWRPNSTIIKVTRECKRSDQKIDHMPYATSLSSPLPTMFHQSQTILPPISFITFR